MFRAAAIALLWAWTGFVSCDDPDRVAAAVRTAAAEPDATVTCREPRLWYSEINWSCKAYLRGQERCFKVHELGEQPWEVTCPRTEEAGGFPMPGKSGH